MRITSLLAALAVLFVLPGIASSQLTFEQPRFEPVFLEGVISETSVESYRFVAQPEDEDGRIGVLTNNSFEPITISAYWGSGDGPLSAIVQWESKGESGDWERMRLGYCGTGLGTTEIAPGESVDIYLPVPSGEGEFRWVVSVGQDGSFTEVFSNPAVIRSDENVLDL